jgi:hypothetical protein
VNDLRYTGLVHSGSPHRAGPRLPFSISAGKTTEVEGFIYASGSRPQGGFKLTQPLGGSSSPPPPRYKGGLAQRNPPTPAFTQWRVTGWRPNSPYFWSPRLRSHGYATFCNGNLARLLT